MKHNEHHHTIFIVPEIIVLTCLEYHVSPASQKGSEGNSIAIKIVGALFCEEQRRLGSIYLLKDAFMWVSEVYIKSLIEIVNRDWSSLTRTRDR